MALSRQKDSKDNNMAGRKIGGTKDMAGKQARSTYAWLEGEKIWGQIIPFTTTLFPVFQDLEYESKLRPHIISPVDDNDDMHHVRRPAACTTTRYNDDLVHDNYIAHMIVAPIE